MLCFWFLVSNIHYLESNSCRKADVTCYLTNWFKILHNIWMERFLVLHFIPCKSVWVNNNLIRLQLEYWKYFKTNCPIVPDPRHLWYYFQTFLSDMKSMNTIMTFMFTMDVYVQHCFDVEALPSHIQMKYLSFKRKFETTRQAVTFSSRVCSLDLMLFRFNKLNDNSI